MGKEAIGELTMVLRWKQRPPERHPSLSNTETSLTKVLRECKTATHEHPVTKLKYEIKTDTEE
jgi:hypothetical protein